ncbi:MAG TPA: hypothetical protein VMV92_22995 [Streptosporangiaceae bacterium]|nr:hypothetical protein [Streptosporangiaceae bacterium]
MDQIAEAGGRRGEVYGVHAHMTRNDCRATGTGTGEAAGRFLAWLAADANPALTKIIQSWLWQPGCSGGLGAPAVCAWDVARLRAEILATLHAPGSHAPQGQGAR